MRHGNLVDLKIRQIVLLSHNSTNVRSDLNVNSNVCCCFSSFLLSYIDVSIVCWCFVLVHTLHILTCLPVYGFVVWSHFFFCSIWPCVSVQVCRACVLRVCMRLFRSDSRSRQPRKKERERAVITIMAKKDQTFKLITDLIESFLLISRIGMIIYFFRDDH